MEPRRGARQKLKPRRIVNDTTSRWPAIHAYLGLNRIRIKESWSSFGPYRWLMQRSVARSVFTEN
jgi:hypothetical protein